MQTTPFLLNPFLDCCGCYPDLNYVNPKSYEDVTHYQYQPWSNINHLQWQVQQQQQQQQKLYLQSHGYQIPSEQYNEIPHIWVPFR